MRSATAWVLSNCKFAQAMPPQAPPPSSMYAPPGAFVKIYDKDDNDAPENYFGLGHANNDDGVGSDNNTHMIWVLKNNRIDARPALNAAGVSQTHGTIWGHEFCDKTWKGRYEGDTGRLSIVAPVPGMQLPGLLMGKLQQTFGKISEVHVF